MRLLFTTVLLLFITRTNAQPADTIAYKRSFMVYEYRKMDGKRFRREELTPLLLSQPESRKYYFKYRRAKVAGTVLALGAAVYTLFMANNEASINAQGRVRPVVFTGAVCFWGGVVLMFNSDRQKLKAVKAYNRSF